MAKIFPLVLFSYLLISCQERKEKFAALSLALSLSRARALPVHKDILPALKVNTIRERDCGSIRICPEYTSVPTDFFATFVLVDEIDHG